MDELGFYGMSFSEHVVVPKGGDSDAIGGTWPDVLILSSFLAGQTERHRGFKCPHCKLFVPADRAAK